MENIWIASFDIGKKNFSFYIEKINILHFKTIKNINKKIGIMQMELVLMTLPIY